ncbi:MAG: matrixin family metalloprotease [Myxococcota bacterium]
MLAYCVEARDGWDEQLVVDAFEAWAALEACDTLEVERVDCAEAVTVVKLGDPDDELDDAGIPIVTNWLAGVAVEVVVNDDYDWATSAEGCDGQLLLEAVLLHEVGHVLGLGHTCEEGEACDDAANREAVMYWSSGACETRELNAADAELLALEYAPGTIVAPDSATRTVAVGERLCLDVEVAGDASALTIEIDWGDGTTGEDPCHVYDAEGAYQVYVTTSWEGTCGSMDTVDAYVVATACDVPHAEDGAGGFFTWTVDGTVATLDNRLDAMPVACVDTVEWFAFDGETEVYRANASSPAIDFGEPGTYRVILAAVGPGGVAAQEAEITVGESGCATVAGGPWWVAIALAARRRRVR